MRAGPLRTRQRPRAIVIGLAAVFTRASVYTRVPALALAAAVTLIGTVVPSSGAAVARVADFVVGFGDSVAAGYGLSNDGQWGPGNLAQRFPGGDASCSQTPQAYPCVLAGEIGDDVDASRDYAIQGAQSDQVQDIELPMAERQLSAAERSDVNVVTLTVGADDIDFAGCLTLELEAATDTCLAGTIQHLTMSEQTLDGSAAGGYDGLDALERRLEALFPALEREFPNAHIYVTSYYQAFAPPGANGPCLLFAPAALIALLTNLRGVDKVAAIAAVADYVANLPQWESRFQDRLVTIEGFMTTALGDAAIKAAQGSPRVTLVPLTALAGRGICSSHALVYGPQAHVHVSINLRAIAELEGVTLAASSPSVTVDVNFSGSADCPFPNRASEVDLSDSFQRTIAPPSGPGSYGAGFGGNVKANGWFKSNCLPHPTVAGQRAIAGALAVAVAAETRAQEIDQPPGVRGATAGYGSPEQPVAGLFTEELVNEDLAGVCQYVVPAQQSACEEGAALAAGTVVTGGVRITGEVIDGDRALVAAVGKICTTGGPGPHNCTSNADPTLGLPQTTAGFDQAYDAAVAANSAVQWSAAPCLKVDGAWYLNAGL